MTPEEARMQALETAVADLREQLSRAALVAPRAVIAPTPSTVNRGQVFLSEGASGAADTLKVVLKAADDTYSVKTIATG